MYIRNNIRFSTWWPYMWRPLLTFTLYDIMVCLLYGPLDIRALDIPWTPIATLGAAVAFYIGFKNNGSYDRFWEGRQLWGSIVNLSRVWSIRIFDYVQATPNEVIPDPNEVHELHRRLLYRHLAWVNAVRLHLRRQSEELRQLFQRGLLTQLRQISLMETVQDLLNAQGGCERIKNTPFPRQYAFFSFLFVWLFAAVLPLGLVEEFDHLGPNHIWMMVPVAVLLSWVFNTIEVVGHISENPFDNQINDVPMTNICRNIEIDLRELLGEKALPPKPCPYPKLKRPSGHMAGRAFLCDCLSTLPLFNRGQPAEKGLCVTSGKLEKDLGKDKPPKLEPVNDVLY